MAVPFQPQGLTAEQADGNILLSERSQDWVLKVNYGNGQGDGHLIWRMGPFGDFTILNPPPTQCGDPNVFPWFTHQHDAAFHGHHRDPIHHTVRHFQRHVTSSSLELSQELESDPPGSTPRNHRSQ